MSLGVGAQIGVGVDDTEVKGNVFCSGKMNSNPTDGIEQFVNPNGQNNWQADHNNGHMVALAAGIFLAFGFRWTTRGGVAAAQAGIAINGVKQAASELTFGGGDTAYKEVSKATLSVISFAKGDLISIYRDGGAAGTDRGGFALVLQYGSESQDNNQIQTETLPQIITTVFRYQNFRNNTTFQTSHQNANAPPGLPGFHKRYFVRIHTAPTAGDAVHMVRRISQAGNMPGTGTNIITDAESDNTIVEIVGEQDIAMLASDDLSWDAVRVGTAGVAPVFSIIIIWEFTLP